MKLSGNMNMIWSVCVCLVLQVSMQSRTRVVLCCVFSSTNAFHSFQYINSIQTYSAQLGTMWYDFSHWYLWWFPKYSAFSRIHCNEWQNMIKSHIFTLFQAFSTLNFSFIHSAGDSIQTLSKSQDFHNVFYTVWKFHSFSLMFLF